MRTLIPVLYFFIFPAMALSCKKENSSNTPPALSDSFTVVINNGYGGGKYKTGDTVHIFCKAYADNQLFDKWSGDISAVYLPDEWHTWFIMPAKDVNITANIKNISPFTLQYTQIMGRDRLKPVYSYFPAGQKGIVYLLHGTNGSAAALVAGYEWEQLIKDLISNRFAVVITECEESTTGTDANNDGKLRWSLLPADTITNVDYANIRIIANSFYNSGVASRSELKYSIGMSDGGFFSAGLSFIYNFKTSIQYCAQGSPNLIQVTNIPTQFCMAANDNNPSVGPNGNAAAFANASALNKRGVCSKDLINQRSPLYPERFAREGTMDTDQSAAAFNELKSKGYIDNTNYYIGYSDGFISTYGSNPSSFPVFNSLTPAQKQSVLAEINLSVADHHMYSDYNRATLKFLQTQCF